MSSCPYTWFVGLFSKTKSSPDQEASHLRVTVHKGSDCVVDVALPARSARWLIDLIPSDVMTKIRDEGIPIDDIQADLAQRQQLNPQKIFTLTEVHRRVEVWLD